MKCCVTVCRCFTEHPTLHSWANHKQPDQDRGGQQGEGPVRHRDHGRHQQHPEMRPQPLRGRQGHTRLLQHGPRVSTTIGHVSIKSIRIFLLQWKCPMLRAQVLDGRPQRGLQSAPDLERIDQLDRLLPVGQVLPQRVQAPVVAQAEDRGLQLELARDQLLRHRDHETGSEIFEL